MGSASSLRIAWFDKFAQAQNLEKALNRSRPAFLRAMALISSPSQPRGIVIENANRGIANGRD
jgi:hypothetical protein